jgi:hypothetical protein
MKRTSLICEFSPVCCPGNIHHPGQVRFCTLICYGKSRNRCSVVVKPGVHIIWIIDLSNSVSCIVGIGDRSGHSSEFFCFQSAENIVCVNGLSGFRMSLIEQQAARAIREGSIQRSLINPNQAV